jgi:hypothetical protein
LDSVPLLGGIRDPGQSNVGQESDCVSFSNRCFPTKAVAIWRSTSDDQHLSLVAGYFSLAGCWSDPQDSAYQPPEGDPLFVVWASVAHSSA